VDFISRITYLISSVALFGVTRFTQPPNVINGLTSGSIEISDLTEKSEFMYKLSPSMPSKENFASMLFKYNNLEISDSKYFRNYTLDLHS
jgi:hypothetical protein